MDTMLLSLDDSINSIQPRLDSVHQAVHDKTTSTALARLDHEWKDVTLQHSQLKGEIKDDGFLTRFRT
jgi:hypothetical protein